MSGTLFELEPDETAEGISETVAIDRAESRYPPGVTVELAPPAADQAMPLVEIMPPGFQLPALIRFVPDARLRLAADVCATAAEAIDVTQEGGLARADVALTSLRVAIKAVEANFADAAALANQLHKHITGKRAEWLERPAQVVDAVGRSRRGPRSSSWRARSCRPRSTAASEPLLPSASSLGCAPRFRRR